MHTPESFTNEPKQMEKDAAEINIDIDRDTDRPPSVSGIPSHPLRTRVGRYAIFLLSSFASSFPLFQSMLMMLRRSVKGYFFPVDPPPPKGSVDDADYTPEMHASFLSNLTFSWLNPLLALGYARPLEKTDLWKLQDHRSSAVIADKILSSFESRKAKADAYNARLASGELKPMLGKRLWWSLSGGQEQKAQAWKDAHTQKPSLSRSLNDSIGAWFWWGGALKIVGDMAEITSPLLIKVFHHYLIVADWRTFS